MSFRCTASIPDRRIFYARHWRVPADSSSFPPTLASAIYSRLREMAKRIRLAKRKPIAAISKNDKYEDENSSATFYYCYVHVYV